MSDDTQEEEPEFNRKDKISYSIPQREEFLNVPKIAETSIFDDIKQKLESMQQQILDNHIQTKTFFEDTQLYVRRKLRNIYTRQEAEQSYQDLRDKFDAELRTTREVSEENRK